ncbi:MAG: ATP-binding cassette domain-containing protein [Prevotella sp.]|nr:ATP-binding cassette domain-containing protein [Prevotella sp.]
MRTVIEITNGTARMPAWRLKEPVRFRLNEGEHVAIVGNNGSGKSKLVDMITGRHPVFPGQIRYDFGGADAGRLVADNIKYISFRDSYGAADSTYYLQQRWNQQEISERTPRVGTLLSEAYARSGGDTAKRRELRSRLYETFNLKPLLDKYVILLSSGEMRKYLITRMLLSDPRVLIMDNPFIGLDEPARASLIDLLYILSQEPGRQIILVVTKRADIPSFVTRVWEMKDERLLPARDRDRYERDEPQPETDAEAERRTSMLRLPEPPDNYNSDIVAGMKGVTIRYGERVILRKLDWTVRNGERWALNGRNGAGKSTLLSLVCADNPQSYACDITLFDRRRGTGETIWEIKKHIGYVSPEMHRAYRKDIAAIKIVASGLNDSVGLYVKPKEEDYARCRYWMYVFGIEHLADRTFLSLSSGEQRMVLLARAFVKDPELLILDEPLHGLDPHNGAMVKRIIDTFCRRKGKTLIMVSHYQDEYPDCINHRIKLVQH